MDFNDIREIVDPVEGLCYENIENIKKREGTQ